LVGAALSLGIFYGCQKNEFDLQTEQTRLSQTESNKTNAVSMDEAKQAYADYLKRKPKDNGSLTVRGDDSEVLWDSAKSFNFADTSGNLIAASTDVYIKGEYKKAFFVRIHDTVKLLQVYYRPTDEYIKLSKGVIQMRNFDGLIGYKNHNDVLLGGYKVKNGQVERILIPKTVSINNLGRDEPAFPNLIEGDITVTATRPTSLWNGYYTLSPVSSSSSSAGPSIGSSGSSTGGGSGSSTGSTGAAAGDSPYSEVVIPSYLYQSRNPQDVLSEMGLTPIEVTYLTVKNRRVGIQVGEAIDALGLEESKATIKVFTNLIRTNTPFKLANIASYYDVNVILSLDKYLKAGFTGAEFAKLWLDTGANFSQVDEFFNQNGFTEENKLIVKGFQFQLKYNDDFKDLNDNRGSKTIPQLLTESDHPKLNSGTLINLARDQGYDVDAVPAYFQKLGRVMEDFVLRSIDLPKNNNPFTDPTGQGRSAVIPDGLKDGDVSKIDIDQNGVSISKNWKCTNSVFVDSKFTAKKEKMIKDNASTNANGSPREQLSTMIDVLAAMKGVVYNTVNYPQVKASDHGIASLYIITLYDVEIDPALIAKAEANNVNVYKRWVEYDALSGKVQVSGSYQDKTPFIATRKRPGYTDPTFSTKLVNIDWTIQ
jgi:hypothetical protein